MNSAAVTIWHNPHCSKSRQTLQLLQEKGCQTTVVRYLDNPPHRAELERVLALLAMEPRQLLRTSEALYKELHLQDGTVSREALLEAMVAHPRLIERPVVIGPDWAAVGRPPENVLRHLT
ncbi:MAG: arsenate reductase (glutaredoxin) [Magnetococcales bacterium]|nr:arsenate reductase (glutaredoxin) [Magnetococcales bacterium]